MAEKTFRVCDAGSGRSACNERGTEKCTVCGGDFCLSHRTSEVTIETFCGSTTNGISKISIGTTCYSCKAALKSPQIVELFSPSIDEILLRVRAHISAEVLKDEKKG